MDKSGHSLNESFRLGISRWDRDASIKLDLHRLVSVRDLRLEARHSTRTNLKYNLSFVPDGIRTKYIPSKRTHDGPRSSSLEADAPRDCQESTAARQSQLFAYLT
jgi:hypothetical protein